MKCANVIFIVFYLVSCDSSLDVDTQKALQDCEADPLAASCRTIFFEEGGESNQKPKQLLLTDVAKDGYISAKDHESKRPIYEFNGLSNVNIKYSAPLAKGSITSCEAAVIDQLEAPFVSEFPKSGEHFICVKLSDNFQDRFFYKSPIFIVDKIYPKFSQNDVLTGRPFLFSWEFTEAVTISWSYDEENLSLEIHGEDTGEGKKNHTFTTTGLSEGEFPMKVTVKDSAGNAVSQNFQFGWSFAEARKPVFAGINQVTGAENSKDFTEAIVSWQPASGECTKVEISVAQIEAEPNFVNPVSTTDCQSTSAIVSGLDPYTKYFFQVRAVNTDSGNEYLAGAGIEMSHTTQPPAPTGDKLSQAALTEIDRSVDKIDLSFTEASDGFFNKNLIWKGVGADIDSATAAVKHAAATKQDYSGPEGSPIAILNAGNLSWSDTNVEIGTSCYLGKSVYDDGQYYLASENEKIFCKTPQYVKPSFSGVVSGEVVGKWPDGSHKIELTFAALPIGSMEEYHVYFSQTSATASFDINATAFDIVDVGHSIQDASADDTKILVGEGQNFTGGFFLVRYKFYGSPIGDFDTNTQVSSYVASYPFLTNDHSLATFDQFGEAHSSFGSAVDMTADALTMVLGAYGANSDGSGRNHKSKAGAAYIYTRANTNSNWAFAQKLVAPELERDISDEFGFSVAISGSTIVVGARYEGTDQSNQSSLDDAGAAYVFIESGGVWSLEQKLVGIGSGGRMGGDEFGYSVDVDGNTLIVGAKEQDYDASGGVMATSAGAAYIFSRVAGVWDLDEKVVGIGTQGRNSYDRFGHHVAISGTTVAIGAIGNDYDAAGAGYLVNSGAVFVFTESGGSWSFEQKLVGSGPNGRGSDMLGYAVAIDGDSIIAGANLQNFDGAGANSIGNAGAAYVFTRSGSSWSLEQKLAGEGAQGRSYNDKFGSSVDIMGDRAIIGVPFQNYDSAGADAIGNAGASFVFERAAGSWSFAQKITAYGANSRNLSDQFGKAVSLGVDALVVGAYLHDWGVFGNRYSANTGVGFSFDYKAGSFIETTKITAGDERTSGAYRESIGSDIAVSADGLKMVACARSHDYNAEGNGGHVLGAAYFLHRASIEDSWIFQQKVAGENNYDQFCSSVGMDGNTAVIGSIYHSADANGGNGLTHAGAAYIYKESAGTWSLEQKLVAQGINARKAGDIFGFSVAIDGDTIAIGSPRHGYDAGGSDLVTSAGAVFVFTRIGATWSLEQKLVAEGTNSRKAWDSFGIDLDLDNGSVLIGAIYQDFDAIGSNELANAGAVFVYTRTGSTWSFQQKLVGEGVNGRLNEDFFGSKVSLSGDTAAITALQQDFDVTGLDEKQDAGAVYLFTRNAGAWSVQEKVIAQGPAGRHGQDFFGSSIDLYANKLIVGAEGHGFDFTGENFLTDAGASYIYERSNGNWKFLQKLTPQNQSWRMLGAKFGAAVSISGDVPVVSSPYQNIEVGNYVNFQGGAIYTFGN